MLTDDFKGTSGCFSNKPRSQVKLSGQYCACVTGYLKPHDSQRRVALSARKAFLLSCCTFFGLFLITFNIGYS